MSKWYDPWGAASEAYHKITGQPTEDEKRATARTINEQVKAYQAQTELQRNELNMKKDQVNTEKRRVEEKQIRNLRRSSRSSGFLGGQESSTPDMTTKLGG